MDSRAQALHVDRIGAPSLSLSDSIQGLVGPSPFQVELSEREVRQWGTGVETGCLLVGSHGSRALECLSMLFGPSQQLQVPTPSRTQDDNQDTEKKR
jgi:hypothetical protein